MRIQIRLAVMLGFLALALLMPQLQGAAVSIGDCPPAVRRTIEREAKGGHFGAINRETANGHEVFLTVVTNHQGEFAIEVGRHGRILHKTRLKAVKAREEKKGEVHNKKGTTNNQHKKSGSAPASGGGAGSEANNSNGAK